MALKFISKAHRREMHFAVGVVHPKVIARSMRELKRGHRRLVRRTSRLRLPAEADF